MSAPLDGQILDTGRKATLTLSREGEQGGSGDPASPLPRLPSLPTEGQSAPHPLGALLSLQSLLPSPGSRGSPAAISPPSRRKGAAAGPRRGRRRIRQAGKQLGQVDLVRTQIGQDLFRTFVDLAARRTLKNRQHRRGRRVPRASPLTHTTYLSRADHGPSPGNNPRSAVLHIP